MQNKSSQKFRRKYDASFRQEVVNMITSGRSVPDIAHSLGIGENIIYRWRKQALNSRETAVASRQATVPLQVSLPEHIALQKRLREVEMERDILKKAVGIFSQFQ